MSDSSLAVPVEILEVIFEDLISEYTKGTEFKFLPRWYLVPLLRVCKLWQMVSERYLYRSISIGRRFAQTLRIREQSERRGNVIAYKLIDTLAANPRLAAKVEKFGLVAEGAQVYWSRQVPLILDICPNLQHVELRGFSLYHLGEITKSLKEKSLVSFRISMRKSWFKSFPIYELMQRWPRLQTIRVEGVYLLTGWEKLSHSGALNCYPELREIIFTPEHLFKGDFASLGLLGSSLTRLGISVHTLDDEVLVESLQAWSPTLQCIRLHIGNPCLSYPRLSEALSALRRLEELQIHEFDVDYRAISGLPQLKRLCYTSIFTSETLGHLSNQLENPAKFAALRHFAISASNRGSVVRRLGDLCFRQNIELQMWDGGVSLSGFLL